VLPGSFMTGQIQWAVYGGIAAAAGVAALLVATKLKTGGVIGLALLGALLGAVLGFLFRPDVPLVGQLPLSVVVSRGASLNGVDILLRSTAEESFNYLVIGAILGAVIMAGAKSIHQQKTSATAAATPSNAAPQGTAASQQVAASASSAFCTKCGAGLGPDVVFCGSCGTRRG